MDTVPGTTPDRTGAGSTEEAPTSPHTSLEYQRRRLSFFGRSNSDASTHRRALPTLNATMPTSKGRADPADSLTSRSSTALSQTRRKKVDPLDSIRKSLVGLGTWMKAPANDQVNPPRPGSSRRSSSRQSVSSDKPNTTLIPFAAPVTKTKPLKAPEEHEFTSEEQYYKHRKKSSISRPFNFQHLTHTAKKHIPLLQTVDERNLTAKFWSVNAYQKPKGDLKEIQADDLSEKLSTQPSELSFEIERPCSSQATTEVAESLDETTFDETQETKFNPDAFETIHEVHHAPEPAVKSPKHYSSMTALSSPTVNDPDKLRHLIKERGTRDEIVPPTLQRAVASSDVRASLPVRPAPPLETLSAPLTTLAGQSQRESKPLPPVPTRGVRKTHSKSSMRTLGQLFPAPPHGRAGSAADSVAGSVAGSFVSKRSSKSVATVNSRTDVFIEPTWEDDIDFAFDQEAEASCDFDWENVASPREEEEAELTPSDHDDDGGEPGGVRLSAWLGDAPSMSSSSSLDHTQHKRGSSVGHRGFQAARTGSGEVALSAPTSLKLGTSASGSPTPLIKASLLECERSPYTEGEMQFPGFDANRAPEYLSDPESSARSSERRKSSSANSWESSRRSMHVGSDTTRWSSASTSSIPDLVQSRRKSRSSVVKSHRMSRQLESVTSADEDDEEASTTTRLQPTRAQTDSFIMRRPSTSGDRTLLFSAGRTVQRGRSATPPSRIALAGGNVAEVPGEDHVGWI
ncbi:uncharacterized protein RCC_07413 [Ramularia collo-cygni]|uniref:CRIB domain-containing protein n=1 Tax=Ramularia collo-cygni TaxID=112498 RepID=A0A2D3V7Y2_9PEZI|nr:uncharacterized protein RCC_07413 [Ramularia collo-cygni]CZT21550.1 uncharacterized protein RCC_07413 [Ramularia collo-cygni]